MNRNNLDGITEGQFSQNIDQQTQCRRREYEGGRFVLFVENQSTFPTQASE